jgi:phosphoglycolate phosphatase
VLVGFDLDMTLLDTRPGIAATYRALSARTGLQQEMAHWFPADEVPGAIATYRSLYLEHAIAPSLPLPGAAEAVAAVRAAGVRVVVVTAKHTPLARLHLSHVGLEVDEVVGDLWAEGKAEPLRGGLAYVGDHVADVRAARAAGVRSVAVATGPCSPDELRDAGADDVLPDLTRFPLLFGAISVGARADG